MEPNCKTPDAEERQEPENEEPLLWQDISLDRADNEVDYIEGYQDSGLNCEYHNTGLQYISGDGFSRYYPSLRHLIPIRKTKSKKKKDTFGIDEAGLWSFITFNWLSKFIYLAYKQKFKLEDVPKCSPYDSCEYNVQRLELLWQNELSQKGPKSASLAWVTWRFIRSRVIVASFIFCLNILLNFLSIAIFMRKLLEYAESKDASYLDGVIWALCLTASELFRSALYSVTWAINFRSAIRLRSACLALMYKKLLRLNSLGDRSVGEMINIFSLDGQRLFDLVLFGPMTIGGPLTIGLGIFYVWWILGPWAVLGFFSFLIFYPIQYILSRLSGYFKAKAIVITDKRITVMSELLYCIKAIKMYLWGDIFLSKVEKLRKLERIHLRRNAYSVSLATSFSATVPYVSCIVTFLVHIAAGNTLTAAQGFPLLSLFLGPLRLSVVQLQYGLSNFIDLLISCKRIKKVLLLNETSIYWSRPLNKSLAVSIAEGLFERHSFGSKGVKDEAKKNKGKTKMETGKKLLNSNGKNDSDYIQILHDVNFFAPKGKLIGICGQVGSGKSSLLSAVLGQMHMTKGKICREGTCAFVSQVPWLINATLKENIIFGEKFNPDRYFKAVYSSCLNDDIAALPGGDDTEIGERGLNLSGGQKQRIALARALYANRDIYLLDDPLSSVDAQVRNQLFERYILNALKGKTVLLVTHKLDCLKKCDGIAVMRDGTVVERGTHSELMAAEGEYYGMVHFWTTSKLQNLNHVSQENDDTQKNRNSLMLTEKKDVKNEDGGGKVLIVPERMIKGSLQMYTVLSYVSASGGACIVLFIILLMLVNIGSTAFSSWWLALWIKSEHGANFIKTNSSTPFFNFEENMEFSLFYIIYASSIAFILISNLIRSYFYTKMTLKASKFFHNTLLKKVIMSPMLFFEITPIGRIQNLFSKDMEDVECKLPITVENFLQQIWQILFAVLFICVIFPWFILPLLFTSAIFYIIGKIFRVGIRDFKRFEMTTRSPIFSTVTTSVHGLDTIHAFNKEKAFWQQFSNTLNLNSSCLFLLSYASRWLAVRVDALAVFIMFITSLLVIIFHSHVPPAMAGLAISYASSVSGMLQFLVRLSCETEVKFLAVERLNIYLSDLQEEGQTEVTPINPPEAWPDKGTINFMNVSLCYRPELPLVLKSISIKVSSGEKIGIVGRTGSGKTSLINALFRLVEITSGKIKIDKVDISTLSLNKLRSKLSVIPQEAILLDGTIRYNLDPTCKANDSDLWDVLEKVKLKEKISGMELKMDTNVSSLGDFLSVGEKQLLCLARALLRKTKIVVLDEATSGIDHETETLVLDTIKKQFNNCTVLTVAHRIETILSSDKVLVMSNGSISEYDDPKKLLENPNSAFSRLVSSNFKDAQG